MWNLTSLGPKASLTLQCWGYICTISIYIYIYIYIYFKSIYIYLFQYKEKYIYIYNIIIYRYTCTINIQYISITKPFGTILPSNETSHLFEKQSVWRLASNLPKLFIHTPPRTKTEHPCDPRVFFVSKTQQCLKKNRNPTVFPCFFMFFQSWIFRFSVLTCTFAGASTGFC